jgi:hypothetical protein
MNHWMGAVSLVGILSTAVVWGTDIFFLTIGRPALRLATISAATEVMGSSYVRRRTNADLRRLGNFVQRNVPFRITVACMGTPVYNLLTCSDQPERWSRIHSLKNNAISIASQWLL